MNRYTLVTTIAALCCIAIPFVAYWLFKFYNSADGERYRKRSMQGPFVPLDAEEIAEDEARKAAARAERHP